MIMALTTLQMFHSNHTYRLHCRSNRPYLNMLLTTRSMRSYSGTSSMHLPHIAMMSYNFQDYLYTCHSYSYRTLKSCSHTYLYSHTNKNYMKRTVMTYCNMTASRSNWNRCFRLSTRSHSLTERPR